MANGEYIGLNRGKDNTLMEDKKSSKIPGQTNGHYIAGVGTEEGNHKDHKRWLHGKKRPDLDALEAGDPDNNVQKK